MQNNICIDCAKQTAQSRKANSSIMLNPSARDTEIVSVDKIEHFPEYCCPKRENQALHESFLQRQLLVIQQLLLSETFIQFGSDGSA